MKNNLQEQAMAEISSSTVRNSVLFLIDSSFFLKKTNSAWHCLWRNCAIIFAEFSAAGSAPELCLV